MMEQIFTIAEELWVLWMMLLFGLVLVYALRPRNRAKFTHAARIPLDDDEPAPDDKAAEPASRKSAKE